MPEFLTLNILKFRSLCKRPDIKNPTWMSISNKIMLHPDFLNITGDEFKAFIWIIGTASQLNNSTIRVYPELCARQCAVKIDAVYTVIEKLESKQWAVQIPYGDVTHKPRVSPATLHYTTQHYITEKNNTFMTDLQICSEKEVNEISFESPAEIQQVHHKLKAPKLKNIPIRINSLTEIENVLGDDLMKTFETIYQSKEFIEKELLKSLAWLQSNPNKAHRTTRGWRQFYTGWLNRASDTASKSGSSNKTANVDVFNIDLKKGSL